MSMDSGTKRRLFLGLVSNFISKAASSVIQLIQVPLFFHFWSTPIYGNWLVVTSIPSFLSLSNIGFGSVAGNEMTMSEARGDRDVSLRVFQSCWWLIVVIMLVTAVLAGALLLVIPFSTLLDVHAIHESETRAIIAYLGVSVLFGQFEQLLQSAYRSVGRYPYGSFIKSCMTLAAFIAMMVPVLMGKGPTTTALVFAAANVAGTLVLAILVRRDIPWIRFGWQHAQLSEIRRMAPLAVAFMGFPLGNAFNLQGTLMAVQYAMGPVAVAIFSTARQVSRIALQMVQMINASFEPEFSRSFAQADSALIRTLHRRACQMALLIAMLVVICAVAGGPYFLHHWTQGKVPPSRPLLMVLLTVVVFYALWSTSSGIMYATNKHQKLAAVYMAATGLTVGVTFMAARWYGLMGAAASLLISELLMNTYVLPASLKIAHDTLPAFLRSLLNVPPALHPRAMLRRLSRSRAPMES